MDSTDLKFRARFLPLYRLITGILGDLVAVLSEVEVMEFVSRDVGLTVPVIGVGEERKPMPMVEVTLLEEEIIIAIAYRDSGSIKHLKNLFHASQMAELESFMLEMNRLPIAFETKLLRKGFRDEKGFDVFRKYISCKVNGVVLKHMIGEAEAMRSGGRKTVDGQSIYEAPAMPVLQLISVSVKPKEYEFKAALEAVKPILRILVTVKTQREIIYSGLIKPVDQTKLYREFVDLLNRARSGGFISSEERRAIDKRWRESLEERTYIEEELKRKIGKAT